MTTEMSLKTARLLELLDATAGATTPAALVRAAAGALAGGPVVAVELAWDGQTHISGRPMSGRRLRRSLPGSRAAL